MNLLSLLVLMGAISCIVGAYRFPLNRVEHHPIHSKARASALIEMARPSGFIPFKYGKIPIKGNFDMNSDRYPLVNFLETQFYGEVQIGTPGQTIKVCLDTGSSNTFVLAPNCSGLACWNRTVFNNTESSTFVENDTTIVLPLGNGNFTGFLGEDDFQLGDEVVKGVEFALIYSPDSPSFLYARFDSIIGLAYQVLAVDQVRPLYQVMMDQGVVESGSFSFYLTKGYNQNGSTVIFDGIDEKYAASEFNYVNLTQETYYMAEVEDVKLGERSFTRKKMNVILDTGTSVIVGPSTIMQDLIDIFPNVIPCEDVNKFAHLEFVIGGVSYKIPPEVYIIENFGHCILGILGAEFGPELKDTIILGDTFIRSYYTHFDYANGRLGFAVAASPDENQDLIYN